MILFVDNNSGILFISSSVIKKIAGEIVEFVSKITFLIDFNSPIDDGDYRFQK